MIGLVLSIVAVVLILGAAALKSRRRRRRRRAEQEERLATKGRRVRVLETHCDPGFLAAVRARLFAQGGNNNGRNKVHQGGRR